VQFRDEPTQTSTAIPTNEIPNEDIYKQQLKDKREEQRTKMWTEKLQKGRGTANGFIVISLTNEWNIANWNRTFFYEF